MRVLLSFILFLGMVGCDGGGTASGPGEDTAVPEDTVGPTGCTLEDLTGRAYRITVLESQQPTDALNPTFAVDIATYVNIIVFHIVEHNQEEGYLMMRAGPCSAAFVDPDAEPPVPTAFYYGLETTPFRVELDGCNFEITEPTVLDMMFKTLNKPYRVDRLLGNGTLKKDPSGIEDGHLEGGILVDTAIDLCTTIPGFGVVNFHWFMNLAHICPNFDTDDDGAMDAYYFAGTFDAVEVTDLFVTDQIVPIESIVEVCDPHDAECFPTK